VTNEGRDGERRLTTAWQSPPAFGPGGLFACSVSFPRGESDQTSDARLGFDNGCG